MAALPRPLPRVAAPPVIAPAPVVHATAHLDDARAKAMANPESFIRSPKFTLGNIIQLATDGGYLNAGYEGAAYVQLFLDALKAEDQKRRDKRAATAEESATPKRGPGRPPKAVAPPPVAPPVAPVVRPVPAVRLPVRRVA